MITYQKEQQKNVVEGFSEFLNMASLYGMNILKKEIHNENDTVKLMTLHASKGLEFSHVFYHRCELWADSIADQKF